VWNPHRERDTKRERERETETDRQTDTHTHREIRLPRSVIKPGESHYNFFCDYELREKK
jgi:hypothetical protein